MRIIPITRLACAAIACLCVAPLFAGALILEIDNPATNPEAVSKHATVVARVTECQSPEKTKVIATAEGIVAGKRKTLPIKLLPLSTPGLYAVTREWPAEGNWAVKIVVTNPDYGNYVTAAVVPVVKSNTIKGPLAPESVTRFYRVPTEQDVASALAQNSL